MDVCRDLRTRTGVPIIMVTARNDEVDRILGLDAGADDYVTKPFSSRELAHRQQMTLASGHIVKNLCQYDDDTEAIQAATTRATQFSGALVTLYGTSGRLVASTATPPLPMPSQSDLVELAEKGFVDVGHAVMAHEVRNKGRVVAIGIVKFGTVPSHWRLAWPVLVLFVALLAVAAIFARHLARPLQHVADVAKKFDHGDLSARVGNQRNDETGEVGRAFDAMADRVARLMAAQQELMANVSHELRTPLSRIQVAVDLITDGKSERVKELVPDIARDLAEVERPCPTCCGGTQRNDRNHEQAWPRNNRHAGAARAAVLAEPSLGVIPSVGHIALDFDGRRVGQWRVDDGRVRAAAPVEHRRPSGAVSTMNIRNRWVVVTAIPL
jgi:CheY-like chemotaxis protein